MNKVDSSQTYNESTKKFCGNFPSVKGNYVGYYEDLVAAIRGKKERAVNPQDSRDGIRVIELARESHNKGAAVAWN